MKFLIILSLIAVASCEFDPTTFDWTSIKPITQTKAYRETFPHLFLGDFLVDDLKVFRNRGGRIIQGEIAKPQDFPFQVFVIC